MARQPLRFTRGTTAQVSAYTGGPAEPVFNTQTKRVHVQDGTTPGGLPQASMDDVDRVRRPMPNDGLRGDGLSARRFIISTDQRDAREWNGENNPNGPGFGMAQRIVHNVGGPGLYGGRIATLSTVIHEAPDNPNNALPQFVGLTGAAEGFSQGGFGGTPQNPRGGLFGGNSIATAYPGYTNVHNITSHEFNNYIYPGASVEYNTGIQVVNLGSVRGTVDAAISIGGNGTTNGILFSDMHAYGTSPVDANGALIGTLSHNGPRFSVTYGLNLASFKFTESILRTKEYEIRGSGSVISGDKDVAGQRQYDFRTSGTASDFDVRLAATGGNGLAGQGTLDVTAALMRISGAVEFSNVSRVPAAVNTWTISADQNAAFFRVRLADGVYIGAIPLTKVA